MGSLTGFSVCDAHPEKPVNAGQTTPQSFPSKDNRPTNETGSQPVQLSHKKRTTVLAKNAKYSPEKSEDPCTDLWTGNSDTGAEWDILHFDSVSP